MAAKLKITDMTGPAEVCGEEAQQWCFGNRTWQLQVKICSRGAAAGAGSKPWRVGRLRRHPCSRHQTLVKSHLPLCYDSESPGPLTQAANLAQHGLNGMPPLQTFLMHVFCGPLSLDVTHLPAVLTLPRLPQYMHCKEAAWREVLVALPQDHRLSHLLNVLYFPCCLKPCLRRRRFGNQGQHTPHILPISQSVKMFSEAA